MTRSDAEEGFTLLEVVCVVAIIAMMVAVLLPRMPRGTSRPRLEAYAIEIASVLKADRSAAIRRRSPIATEVSTSSRWIRSGATGKKSATGKKMAADATRKERTKHL